MAKWTYLSPASDLPPGERLCADAEGVPVIVFNLAGRLLAVQNTCPHAGQPLTDADLRGKVLTCVFHGYAFNIENGRNIDFPYDEQPLRMYPVEVQAGRIVIDVSDSVARRARQNADRTAEGDPAP